MDGFRMTEDLEVSSAEPYRNMMARYLSEAHRMIVQLLVEAGYAEVFPHVVRIPEGYPHAVLLLQKAHLHIEAVLRANGSDNAHSMAVHSRVVLECACQMLSEAEAWSEGSRKEHDRLSNEMESDYWNSILRFSRGRIGPAQIQQRIIEARKAHGQDNEDPPEQVTIRDKLRFVPDGTGWYDYLTLLFCHPKDEVAMILASPVYYGGVATRDMAETELACAETLWFLNRTVMAMLTGGGFLLQLHAGELQSARDLQALTTRWLAAQKEGLG